MQTHLRGLEPENPFATPIAGDLVTHAPVESRSSVVKRAPGKATKIGFTQLETLIPSLWSDPPGNVLSPRAALVSWAPDCCPLGSVSASQFLGVSPLVLGLSCSLNNRFLALWTSHATSHSLPHCNPRFFSTPSNLLPEEHLHLTSPCPLPISPPSLPSLCCTPN